MRTELLNTWHTNITQGLTSWHNLHTRRGKKYATMVLTNQKMDPFAISVTPISTDDTNLHPEFTSPPPPVTPQYADIPFSTPSKAHLAYASAMADDYSDVDSTHSTLASIPSQHVKFEDPSDPDKHHTEQLPGFHHWYEDPTTPKNTRPPGTTHNKGATSLGTLSATLSQTGTQPISLRPTAHPIPTTSTETHQRISEIPIITRQDQPTTPSHNTPQNHSATPKPGVPLPNTTPHPDPHLVLGAPTPG
jgi:hypothetical protein